MPKNASDRNAAVPLPTVLQFMQLLWAVVHGLESTSKRMSGALGVTGPQRLVLRVLGLRPGISAGALASVLHVHPSTLTGVIRRLIDQRLLIRTGDRQDRRRAVLHLTARGARTNALRAGTVEAAIARALEKTSRADRHAAQRVLKRVAAHLQPGGQRDRHAQTRSASPRRSTTIEPRKVSSV